MGGINSFCVNAYDPSKFITVGQERQITFWDVNKTSPEGSLSSSPNHHESDELFYITASPDGKYFATGGSLGIVRVWDFSSGACLSEQKGHSGAIACVRFSPDGKQIVSTGTDGLVLVWNVFS